MGTSLFRHHSVRWQVGWLLSFLRSNRTSERWDTVPVPAAMHAHTHTQAYARVTAMAGVCRRRSPLLLPSTTQRRRPAFPPLVKRFDSCSVTVHRRAYGTTTSIKHGWHKSSLADTRQVCAQRNLRLHRCSSYSNPSREILYPVVEVLSIPSAIMYSATFPNDFSNSMPMRLYSEIYISAKKTDITTSEVFFICR